MAPGIMVTNIFLLNSKVKSSLNNINNMVFICKMQQVKKIIKRDKSTILNNGLFDWIYQNKL